MIEAARAVVSFNRDLLGIPERPVSPMPANEYEHLKKAFQEEFFKELGEAWSQEDVVKMVDSILDGIYFAIGGLYKMGLSPQQIHDCFMHVHAKNMEKKKGRSPQPRHTPGVPDAVKPEGFEPAEAGIAAILGFVSEE